MAGTHGLTISLAWTFKLIRKSEVETLQKYTHFPRRGGFFETVALWEELVFWSLIRVKNYHFGHLYLCCFDLGHSFVTI